jgi:hypothetical protein
MRAQVFDRFRVFGVDYCLSKAAVPVRRRSWGAALILSSALCAAEEPSSVNGTHQHADVSPRWYVGLVTLWVCISFEMCKSNNRSIGSLRERNVIRLKKEFKAVLRPTGVLRDM